MPYQRGAECHNWQGDDASYSAIHQWLNYHYPRSGICESCGGTDRRTEYATKVQGVYPRDREGYLERCCQCHSGFDGTSDDTRTKMSASHKGVPKGSPSEETRAKISTANKGRTVSPETRAKLSAAGKARWARR